MNCPICNEKLRMGQELKSRIHFMCDNCKTLVIVRKGVLRVGEAERLK